MNLITGCTRNTAAEFATEDTRISSKYYKIEEGSKKSLLQANGFVFNGVHAQQLDRACITTITTTNNSPWNSPTKLRYDLFKCRLDHFGLATDQQSTTVIRCCKEIFSWRGFPRALITDCRPGVAKLGLGTGSSMWLFNRLSAACDEKLLNNHLK